MQSENDLQKTIVEALHYLLPDNSLLHHSPNEGRRHVSYMVKLKKLGMKSGWPDLQILVDKKYWHKSAEASGIYIELKTSKGRLTDNQNKILKKLENLGQYSIMCRSLDEVITYLQKKIKLKGDKNETNTKSVNTRTLKRT